MNAGRLSASLSSGVGGGEKMYHYGGQRRAAWVVTVWLAADAVRCSQKN
jgi:hypothetical protein